MTITEVSSSTFIADVVNLIKDKLNTNITDPIASSRTGNDKFVMTEYPRRPVKYPIITVRDISTRQESRLGMSSEGTLMRLGIEIRIWARNVKERDELFDSVYDYLRTNQLDTDGLIDANLHDFKLASAVNVSEENIRSKVLEINFMFVCE